MIRVTDKRRHIPGYKFCAVFGAVMLMALLLVASPCGGAQTAKAKQKAFTSADEAVKALVDAAKAKDTKAMLAIFGPEGKGMVFSGDEVADKEILDRFVTAYETKNRLEETGESKAVLYIGNDEWPFPVPVVKKAGKWSFDTGAGKAEILNRRIGKNELYTLQTCLAYVDAQKEYALGDYDKDGLFEYAQKFMSDPGKKNGLYWETKEGEELSPMGSLVAKAKSEGYGKKKAGDKPVPYHGYLYKILKAQGNNTPGGAYDYVVKGKMIGGFALVAYPAQYGTSGIMTFIVNQDGIVYEKNLGKNTAKTAGAMKAFDPDGTWKKVQ